MTTSNEIKDKQARFAREYLIDLNAKQAAIRAGYSPRSASVTASRLLTYANVIKAIDKGMAKRAKRTEITADMVLQELAKIAFANTGDYIEIADDGGARVDLSNLTLDQAAAISEIVVDDRGEAGARTRLKLLDKRAALVDIGRHLGMFIERRELTGPDGGPIEVGLSASDKLARLLDSMTPHADDGDSKPG